MRYITLLLLLCCCLLFWGEGVEVVSAADTVAIRQSGELLQKRGEKSALQAEKREAARELNVRVYYRHATSRFDSIYLSNASAVRQIDSIITLNSVVLIDSFRIVGYASPEGGWSYNQKLSLNRAEAMKEFLVKRYPDVIKPQAVLVQAGGENWSGFREMIERDANLSVNRQVLTILDDATLNDDQRQQRIEQLDNGRLYRSYLLPRYYRYLRTGASVFVVYDSLKRNDRGDSLLPLTHLSRLTADELTLPSQRIVAPSFGWTSYRLLRPLAIKSNLLGDLATLLNVEVEVPIGRWFSVLAEWNFPFWGGLGNSGGALLVPFNTERMTLQMLAGGVEARYWLPRSKSLDRRAREWGDYNALNGWFVGLYAGVGLYDFQLRERGVQGDFLVSGGISGGYAHPVGKNLHLEYSVAVGYLQTQYYNYTMREGHKVVDIRADGQYDRRQQSYFGPSKLKVSLVWIPQIRVKGKRMVVNALSMIAE